MLQGACAGFDLYFCEVIVLFLVKDQIPSITPSYIPFFSIVAAPTKSLKIGAFFNHTLSNVQSPSNAYKRLASLKK